MGPLSDIINTPPPDLGGGQGQAPQLGQDPLAGILGQSGSAPVAPAPSPSPSPNPTPQGPNLQDLIQQFQQSMTQSKALEQELSKPVDFKSQVLQQLGDEQSYLQSRLSASLPQGKGGKALMFLTDFLRGVQKQPSMAQAVVSTAKDDYQKAIKDLATQVSEERNQKTQQLQLMKNNQAQLYQMMQIGQKQYTEQVQDYDKAMKDIRTNGGTLLPDPNAPVPPGMSPTHVFNPMTQQWQTWATRPPEEVTGKVTKIDAGMVKRLDALYPPDSTNPNPYQEGDVVPTTALNKILAGPKTPTTKPQISFLPALDQMIPPNQQVGDFKGIYNITKARITAAEKNNDVTSARQAMEDAAKQLMELDPANLKAKEAVAAASARGKESGSSDLVPDFIQKAGEDAYKNPKSFESLTPKVKEKVSRYLSDNYGLQIAGKIPSQVEERAANSRATIQAINELSNDLRDPKILNNLGPISGNIDNLKLDIGTKLGLDDDTAKKVSQFRSALNFLTFREGQSIMGARFAQQVLAQLKKTTPQLKQEFPILLGALDAGRRNSEDSIAAEEQARFGGKMRPEVEAEITTPPIPILSGIKEGETKNVTNQKTGTTQIWTRYNGQLMRLK